MTDKGKAPALLIGFGEPAEGAEEDEDLAGKALAKAIKSGKGIKEAFKTMLRECQSEDEAEPVEEDED